MGTGKLFPTGLLHTADYFPLPPTPAKKSQGGWGEGAIKIWRDFRIYSTRLGNGWSCWQRVIVGVLTLPQHSTNTKVSTVDSLFLVRRWNFNYAPTVDFVLWGQYMLADNSRVIFLNIKFILIMQNLYNLLLRGVGKYLNLGRGDILGEGGSKIRFWFDIKDFCKIIYFFFNIISIYYIRIPGWKIAIFLRHINAFWYLKPKSRPQTCDGILELIINTSKAKLNDKMTQLSHVGCWELYIRKKNIHQVELD